MSVFENADTLKLLQNLLKPPEDSSDSEDDYVATTSSNRKFGPGNIGPKTTTKSSSFLLSKEVKPSETKPLLSGDDEKDEVEKWLEKQEQEDNDVLEDRAIPKYDIAYKQAIGTEDIYLQMNNRTTASSSCEDMIIKIELPEEIVDVEDMNLSVTEKEIDLKTPMYRLKLPLIHEIDPNKGKASYDSDKKVLTLTLRMRREFDFVNF